MAKNALVTLNLTFTLFLESPKNVNENNDGIAFSLSGEQNW